MRLHLTLNGSLVDLDEDPTTTLLEWLRARGMTGTKEGCAIGVCGACTVLVDSRPVSACLTLMGTLGSSTVVTVEGIAETEPALIDAFVGCEAMQCGICTPGHVMAAAAAKLAGIGSRADVDSEIRKWLDGNLCRCTGYETIVAAVRTYVER